MKTLLVIVGPTAVGKTSLAVRAAKLFRAEIISADSRQFFKETKIGTAKPSTEELSNVKHHFINSHSIHDFFSTGDFELEALKVIKDIFQTQDLAIMVGGSGLYVNAVCHGLDKLPDTDLDIRQKLNDQFHSEGITSIRDQLEKLDPEYFSMVDADNPQRMIRGVEFYLSTGKKLSSFLTGNKKKRPFNIIKVGLDMPREQLYDQINKRVEVMMSAGLLKEVEVLLPLRNLNSLKTVGYTELFDYLEEKLTITDAVDKIKQNTRRFAKRQLTWFRKDPEIKWFEPNQESEILSYVEDQLKNI